MAPPTFLLMYLGLFLPGFPLLTGSPEKDTKALPGTWQMVEMEYRLKDAAKAYAPKCSISFVDDHLIWNVKGWWNSPTTYSYQLFPSRSPKQIELTFLSGPSEGIKTFRLYRLRGKTLILVLSNNPRIERPRDFIASPKSLIAVMTFERVK